MKQVEIFIQELPTYDTLQELAQRYPTVDADTLACYVVLNHVTGEILSRLDRLLAGRSLSRGRLIVLGQLNRTPDKGQFPFDLAKKSGVTRATMTGLVDGLERDGLVTRGHCAADRRRQFVRLTPKGRRLLDRLMPVYLSKIDEVLAGLGKAEKRTLLRLLTRTGTTLPGLPPLE